jgi:Family of unknown function (DUF6338)
MCPGYAWVRVSERRRPRPDRSALLELAELVSVGAFSSALALLAGLLIAKATAWIDLRAFARQGTKYVLVHPERGLTFLLLVLVASYVGTYLVALAALRHLPAAVSHASVWYEALGDAGATRRVRATVELRDGRAIRGNVASFDFGADQPPETKNIQLVQPLNVRAIRSTQWEVLYDECVVVPGNDIGVISLNYAPEAKRQGARWWRRLAEKKHAKGGTNAAGAGREVSKM